METDKNKTQKEKGRRNSASAFTRSTKLARSPEKVQVTLPASEPKETVVAIKQQSRKLKINQACEKLDELLEFVLTRPNIYGGIRTAKELVAEAEVEETEGLTAAENRAVKAESRAEVAELAFRKKVGR